MKKFEIELPTEVNRKLKETLIDEAPDRITKNLKKSEIKY